jgi:hypothetical protein
LRRPANSVTGTCDEGHLACKPRHRSLLEDRKFATAGNRRSPEIA